VTERRTVSTRDGEILGVNRRDAGLTVAVAAGWMPERYGRGRRQVREEYGAAETSDNAKLLLRDALSKILIDSGTPHG